MVTATDTKPGGFHETGTSTPKLAFSECYTDENRRKVKLVHNHVWQMNLTHTCVEELAPVIHSAVSGDLIQMQRFSAEQLEMLKMMAATNIPKPCLYRIMRNLNQGITWPYELACVLHRLLCTHTMPLRLPPCL